MTEGTSKIIAMIMEIEGMVMENKFTQKELQLLHAACMYYGNKLAEINKSFGNEDFSELKDRSYESWNLAEKISDYMKEIGNGKGRLII